MRMKLLAVAVATSLLFVAGTVIAYADGQPVVSLGVDLSEDQRVAILKYFGITDQNTQVIWVNNQQERDLLSSYVPIEQIGTHTYSCAYIQPTTSGGIQVRTANLNWVTSNMIATTLSTAGVTNCNVIAVAPFEMSGTGALTGVILAYEEAIGNELDPVKKEIATQELITTGTLADELGKGTATDIVNQIKIQVIEGQVEDEDTVIEIVNDVVDDVDTGSVLSDSDRQLLEDLAIQIAQQKYDYEEMKDTLERVEQNVQNSGSTVVNNNTTNNIDNSVTNNSSDNSVTNNSSVVNNYYEEEENILNNVDESALGENVISSSTYETQEITESFVVDQTEGSSPVEGNELQIAETDSFSMDEGNYQEETEDLGSEGYTVQEGAEEPEDLWSEGCVNLEDDLVRLADDSVSGYVRLFINGTSVIPENGEVRSLDEFGNTLWYVDLTEKDSWVASAMSDSDKDNLGWSEGSEVIIFTGEGTSFGITGKVSVNATFVDGNLAEIPINKEFDLQDDGYEVSIRYAGRQSLLKNSIIYGEVCVDDSIKYATLSVEDETIAVVSKDTIEFVDGSDVFSITLLESGRTTLTADFYDAEGNLVGETDVFVGVLQEQ